MMAVFFHQSLRGIIMTVATIGSVSSSNTDMVLPVASQDLYTSAVKTDELKYFKQKGIINFEGKLAQAGSAGLTVHLRNLFRQDGAPLRGDVNPYENAKDPVYGDRTLSLYKLNRPFKFTKKNSISQQATLIDLQKGHEASHMNYFTDLVIKNIFTQAGLNNGTTFDCAALSISSTTNANEILSLSGNNAVNFNASDFGTYKRYHCAGGVSNAQSLGSSNILTTKELQNVARNIAQDVAYVEPFAQLGGGKYAAMVIAQSDLHNLMNEQATTGSAWTFSKAFEYAAQAGKIQNIGMMQVLEIIGIPLDLIVFPDSYFHKATHSSTAAPVDSTRRLFALGKNALDFVLGQAVAGKDFSPFSVEVDTDYQKMSTTGYGNVSGVYGVKNTQFNLKSGGSTLVPLSTYILDVHVGA
jgi:hypothetical protein